MMADTELDELVDRLRPDLKIAFRSLLEGAPGHLFDVAATYDGKRVDNAIAVLVAYRPVMKEIEKVLAQQVARRAGKRR